MRFLVLSLAAAAPILPLPVGIPLLVLAMLAAIGGRTRGAAGRRLAIIALLIAATACLTVAAVRSWRLSAGQVLESRHLASRYAELWEELREPAADLRATLPSLADAADGELFSRLRAAAREAGAESTALLFDADGRAVAWSGAGLLHEASDGSLMTAGADWRLGLTAATLLWVEDLQTADGTWRLITGRSMATDRLPRQLTPGGELPVTWTLMHPGASPQRQDLITIEAEGFPTLVVEPPAGEALAAVRQSREDPWRRRAAALVAVALAFAGGALRGPPRRRLPPIGLLSAAFFAGSWACGAAWPAALALAAGSATLLAATHDIWYAADADPPIDTAADDEPDGWRQWLPTSTLAVLRAGVLVAAYPLLSGRSTQVTEVAWAGSVAVVIAATLHLIGRRVRLRRRTAYLALAIALVALAVGGGLALPPWGRLAALTVAVAAGGVWLGPWAVGRDWRRMLAAAVLAAGVGGLLYHLAGGWISPPRTDGAPAPTAAELESETRRLERRLGRVTLPAWRTPDAEHGQLQDLALALWRQSPLARRGVLSALTVERHGRAISSFAFGLPMTEGDRLDTNPNRWQELRLPGWNQTLIQGDGVLAGLGEGVRIRYWELLRPGFRIGEPLTPDLATGLVRGPPVARRPATGLDEVDADPASLRPRLWSAPLRAITPLPARQELGRGLGLAARILVAAAGTTVVALLFVLPARRIRRLLRGAWSSYSHRLVGVFALLVLATLIPLQTVLVGMVSRRMDAEQLQHGMAALESTQRVLGEYVDSLPPGFGVQTTLDDELLSWLARVIHHEVNLYWDSSVYASSRRELFTAGLLPVRIPGEIYADLALTGAPVSTRRNRVGESSYLEIYAPLRVPGMPSQEKLFLSIPLLAQQEAVAAEVETLRRRTLLTAGALFLILLAVGTALARSFAGPLQEMAAGTRRIAGGAERLELEPGFRELVTLAAAIDDMARRIGEGRRRLLSEKQLVDRVVDSVTSAVISLDGQGRVLLCNRVARQLLGVEPGGDLRQALSDRPGLQPVLHAVEAVSPAPLAHTVRLPPTDDDAEEREWAIVVTPLPDGEEPSTLLVVEDITEVLRGQRLQAWAEMARIIAHEIKNPLTPIRLSAEHLREVYQMDPQGVGRILERCTDNILRQVDELRQIAGEFATFSQIPRLERREADLTELVAETVSAYERGSAAAPRVRLTGAPPECLLDLDPRLIGRVLRNLLENALGAVGTDGEVDVRIEAGDEAVSVIVADSGPGVPTEMLSRIFDPYFSTREGGTGLGLPISRRIAEEHGGALVARNHSHLGGLEVELRLPRDPATPPAGAAGAGRV